MNAIEKYFQENHRPVWAEINLDHVAHNLQEFRRILPSHTNVMAVVKADAYGHGAIEVAQAALQAGATDLAVALVEEGIVLRRHNITAPILLLGVSAPGTEDAVLQHDICPAIASLESAQRFSDRAQAAGKTIDFHVKLDTGMGRIGVRPEQLAEFLEGLQQLSHLSMAGVFSHFSRAGERDKSYTHQQMQRFRDCLSMIQQAGFTPAVKYLANSAGTINIPESHGKMVRLGISLYGLYPSDEVDRSTVRLKPVMSWKTRVVHVKTVAPGEAISYNGMFVTQRPTVVATLPLGYADGFRRCLWIRDWHVLVQGQRAPIIGKICMDMCMIDVTDIAGVAVNDEVVLLGTQGSETIQTDDMAAALNTINYEITSLVGKRVPRLYVKNNDLVAISSLLGRKEI
ncbi:alanine racemase [candidate division KSB3 bacterium]|uniref:Alanine racemase n=1 Tax=candidate division KSB3 bacterium TaxID=2044937 RepID=A0A2G6KKK5_9BACT|nr:MAG: alanine racemase [candidate division KSB3 bacterium]